MKELLCLWRQWMAHYPIVGNFQVSFCLLTYIDTAYLAEKIERLLWAVMILTSGWFVPKRTFALGRELPWCLDIVYPWKQEAFAGRLRVDVFITSRIT